jgi:hypothetical protein
MESLAIGDVIIIKMPTEKIEVRRIGASSSLDTSVDIVIDVIAK